MKVFPLVLLLLFSSARELSAQADQQEQIETQREELERIQKELEVKRNSIEKLKGKEKGVLAELSDLEEELELVNKLIKKMSKQERDLTKNISLRNLELMEAELILQQKRRLLAARLNQVYRYGKYYRASLLLSAESPVDLVKRFYFLEKLTQKDRELIDQVLGYISTMEQTKAKLVTNLEELQKLKRGKIKEEDNREQILAQKQRLLKNIRQDRKTEESAAAELERSMLTIQKFIEEFERKKISPNLPEGVFAASKGRLTWPVGGNVIATFGEQIDPKNKTVTFNPGVVIRAPWGAPVQAVADGVVIYDGWLRGYGRFLILQHDSGYYTLYAHLGDVLVENGTAVQAGDHIALVGDSGSLVGPALHFEIRQGKQQLDPMEWLK